MTRKLMTLAILALFALGAGAATYYAAPVTLGDGDGRNRDNAMELTNAINRVNAEAGGTIILRDGTYEVAKTRQRTLLDSYNGYSYYVLGAKNCNYEITLRSESGDPADVIIDGAKGTNTSTRTMHCWGNGIRIRGVTFANGGAGDLWYGGAIKGADANAAASVIDNCVFRNNRATSGAAVSGVSIKNSTIRGNGSGGNNSGTGSAVYGANVSNCTFVANTCGDRGGVTGAIGDKTQTLVDSRFLYNTNSCWCGDGGTVGGFTNVIRCSFVGNRPASGCNVSGGIRSVNNVIACAFTNNYGSYGLAYSCGRVVGCDFFANGGRSVYSSTFVSNCTFVANRFSGGMIEGATTKVYDSVFFANTNTYYQGSGCALNNVALAQRCSFVRNNHSAGNNGGAVSYVKHLFDCVFTNNVTGGYAASAYGCSNLVNCTFYGETGNTGGALCQPDIVSNCTFINCLAWSRTGGGAIWGKSTTKVYDSTFINCTNSAYVATGSAITTVGTLERCSFTGCYNDYNYMIDGFGALVSCTFTNNFGGWVNGRNNSVMTNCLFAYGKKTPSFYVNPINNVSNVVNCTIVSNTVASSYQPLTTTANVYNSIVIDNKPYDVNGSTLYHTFYGTARSAPTADDGCRSGVAYADVKFATAADAPAFSLRPRSPARGAGLFIESMTNETDLAGHPRVFRNQLDLGAYEYYTRKGLLMLVR